VSSAGSVGSRVSSKVGRGFSSPSSFKGFNLKVGFYKRGPKASRSAKKLYAIRFTFYS
jgi:hypothetical protein